jgi:S1-C subfamily serine protease
MKTRHAIILAVLLSGCVNPSTMLVNQNGQLIRCATMGGGYGIAGAIAITAANQAHNGCVSDFQRVGYVKVPDTMLGVTTAWNGPLVVVEAMGPAAEAGIKAGDQIVSINDKPVATTYDMYKSREGKSAGDKVKVVVKRNSDFTYSMDSPSFSTTTPYVSPRLTQEMVFEPVLVNR